MGYINGNSMEKTEFHKADPWYHSLIENQDNED